MSSLDLTPDVDPNAQYRLSKEAARASRTSYDAQCKNCPPNTVVREDYAQGKSICTGCGLVVSASVISDGSEWQTFKDDDKGENDDDPNRVGGPENGLLGNQGLATAAIEGYGRYQKDQRTPEIRRCLEAFRYIARICDQLSLVGGVTDDAKRLYKRVDEEGTLKARKLEHVCIACIYLICKKRQNARQVRELASTAAVDVKKVWKCVKGIKRMPIFKRRTGVNAIKRNKANYNPEAHSTARSMPRYCNQLTVFKADLRYQQIAEHVANQVSRRGLLEGSQPATRAGGVLMLVAELTNAPVDPRDISAVTGQSQGTIKKAFKVMQDRRVELVQDNAIRKKINDLRQG